SISVSRSSSRRTPRIAFSIEESASREEIIGLPLSYSAVLDRHQVLRRQRSPRLCAENVVLDDAVVLLVVSHRLESRLRNPDSPFGGDPGTSVLLAGDRQANRLARWAHRLDDDVIVARALI